jgi:hypothetical protein
VLNINDLQQVDVKTLCVKPLLTFVARDHIASFWLIADAVQLGVRLGRGIKLKEALRQTGVL